MRCEELFLRIDALEQDYLSVWEEVCNIESPTRYKEGVDAVGAYLVRMAEERGWRCERFPQREAGDVIEITMNPDAREAPVSLSGHMDTVHPVGLFGTPAVRREGDRMIGPGVLDCKGGIVAGLLAMDALRSVGFRSRPIRLLLQSDEEVGSSLSGGETIRRICERAKGSVAFLNLEGHTPGEVCLIRKGIVTYTFSVTGVAAHASNCATAGANAILDAAFRIIELEKLKDDEGLTCCCGVIEGGTAANTVPSRCVFRANVRFANAEQMEWVERFALELAAREYVPRCTCTVERSTFRPAMEYAERNGALLETMNRIYEENGLPRLTSVPRKGGSDAAYTTLAKIPTVDSLGTAGGRIHSKDEYAYLSSLTEAAKRIASVIYCI